MHRIGLIVPSSNTTLGGPNDTACHLDIPMRGCSLFLDDEPIVLDGDLVVKAMRMRD